MLATLFSTLAGVFTGTLPSIFKFMEARQDHKREIELMEFQHLMMKEQGAIRLEETQVQADSAATTAAYQHDNAGINRVAPGVIAVKMLVRPFIAALMVGLTIYIAVYSLRNPSVHGVLSLEEIVQIVLSFTGAIIGYYFADRGMSKALSRER